jgi:hypothetical protein
VSRERGKRQNQKSITETHRSESEREKRERRERRERREKRETRVGRRAPFSKL